VHTDGVVVRLKKGKQKKRAPAAGKPGPAGVALRKQRVRIALPGDPTGVEGALCALVRDKNIGARRAELAALGASGAPYRCFYNLRPRAGSIVSVVKEHVDHSFECQMLAHVLCFDPSAHAAWGGGGAASLLGAVDVRAAAPSKLKEQPAVVEAALVPIFRVQNCAGDAPFNLKLLGGSVNATKGAAVKTWLSARARALVADAARGGGGGGGGGGGELGALLPALEAAFLKSAAAGRGEVGDAGSLAAAVVRELACARHAYTARLEAAAVAAEGAGVWRERLQAAARIRSLAEGVDALLEDALEGGARI
jgi:hypothetical protein